MDRLEFRTGSLTRDRWERLKARSAGGSLPWIVPAVLVVSIIGNGVPGSISPVRVNGDSVEGHRILLLRDDSESMNQHDSELQKQKAALSSVVVREVTMKGFGVITYGTYSNLNLLATATRELADANEFDTVYVLSDFEPYTFGVDCDDRAGLLAFRSLLHGHRLRLYLSTVSMRPTEGLLEIANESGGGLIGLGSPTNSAALRGPLCTTGQ